LDFIELKNQAPERLCTAFASLIKLYKMGAKGLKSLSDDPKYLEFFKSLDEDPNTAKQVHIVLSNQQMWGQDLSQIDLLKEAVTSAFNTIELNSIDQTIETIQQS
jgi:tagaturonate reductase